MNMNNNSNNFSFLQKYQQLQNFIMYDELIDLGYAVIGYSYTDSSTFWNNALTDQVLNDEEITKIEERFKLLGRKSTFFFEHSDKLKKLTEKLELKQYKKGYEDCWQFWQGEEIDKKHFDLIKKVSTSEELEIFLEVFNNCYQKDDPQNPYGELGNYLKAAKYAWDRHHQTDRIEYFIVYKDSKPVSVSTLTNFKGIGYISNVGSLREVRGEGFGKAATLYCVSKSMNNGNTEHCLATEEGHYPNLFYQRIGFAPRFVAFGYTKNQ